MSFIRLPSFIKVPSNKRFKYKPLFYSGNEDDVEKESGKEDPARSKEINFRNRFAQKKQRNKQILKSRFRLIGIIIVLLFLVYYLLGHF